MKKILAVLLALSMLFAFAACGGNNEDTTTTAEETTEAIVDATDAAEDTTAAPAEESTAAGEEATTVEGETTAEGETTTAVAGAGLNSTDIAEVVAYYNAAVIESDKGETKGQSTMKLASEITGDGVLGAVLGIAQPIIESTLEKNSTPTDDIPGRGTLLASDVSKASAVSANGKTTINITLKTQVDGPDAANGTDTGPVARGIGTLGNIDGALEALGATISEGRETVKLTYRDATIKCVVDEATNKITSGTWKHNIDVDIADAKITLGVNIKAKNLHAVIAYQVVV